MRRIVYQTCQINRFRQKIQVFTQNPTCFSMKFQSLKLLSIFNQKYHLRRIPNKYCQDQQISKSLVSFSEWPIYFPGNLKLLNVFSSLGHFYFLWNASWEKMPRLPILGKKQYLFKTTSISPNKPKFWLFWEFRCIMKVWHAISIKNAKKCSWILSRIFSQKTSFSLQKNSSFELLEIAWAIKTFGKHSEVKYPCLAFLKTFECSFEKKTSLSPKNPNFWTSSKHTTNSKIRDVFEKKLAKLSVSESFKTFFSRDLSILRILGQWILLVHILDEISHVHCFWNFSRMFC